jgi:hypothetical protein
MTRGSTKSGEDSLVAATNRIVGPDSPESTRDSGHLISFCKYREYVRKPTDNAAAVDVT